MNWNQFEKGIVDTINHLETIHKKKISDAIIIQDAVYGPIKLDKLAISLLEHPLIQRLRYIKQLGCANYVYPSANHNRFEHSLGVYFITCNIIEQLKKELIRQGINLEKDLDFKTLGNAMKAAAILHDIGQPPFSHDLEPFLETAFIQKMESGEIEKAAPHELLSKLIIEKSDFISNICEEFSIDKSLVGNFITGNEMKDSRYLFAQKVINGDIDADKIDYLLRDAHFTGVPFGRIDYDRILNMFTVWDDGQAFQLAGIKKGYMAFESLVISRFQMFIAVYNHHTSRVASAMLLYRFNELQKIGIEITPDQLLSQVDASILSKIANLEGQEPNQGAENNIGFNLMCRNLFKRFLLTDEEIIIKNQKVKNFMARFKPYYFTNQMKINDEINSIIKEKKDISNSKDFYHNLPYILIDIPKEKLFSDLNFVLIDPADPNIEEVQQLRYIGRFLRHLSPLSPIIPWISYGFIQNRNNGDLNTKIKDLVLKYFKDKFDVKFWVE